MLDKAESTPPDELLRRSVLTEAAGPDISDILLAERTQYPLDGLRHISLMLPLGQQAKAQFSGIRTILLAVGLNGYVSNECAAVPMQEGMVLFILRPSGNEGFGLGCGRVRWRQTKQPHFLGEAEESMKRRGIIRFNGAEQQPLCLNDHEGSPSYDAACSNTILKFN